ncbi:glycosyltransferase family 2 protein [Microbacterium sp. B2969]|uniref:Glycosyltransferase family 2 protein n=1 Tax=Microbacterium alkaliflavum TaxID=3248839 RepID=A0ABW7Q7X7_9MICO
MNVVDALYPDVPLWAQVLFTIALVVAILSFVSVVTLIVVAARFRRRLRRRRDGARTASPDDFVWLFLVPALNEEVTIADSVARLQETRAARKIILVIDDGSDDSTGKILARIEDPRLHVLTRALPEARTGKSDALNAAYREAGAVLALPEFAGVTRDRVIVGVVDADGRLDPDAPAKIAVDFTESSVGGVQTLVRIYNRRGFLTWGQDVEFSTFGLIFQAGRAWWGTANMGGNGQFNRLSALDTIVDEERGGPWRDRLTEDQDLGVRLQQAGWKGEQNNEATIDQQGLNSLRRLYRQRVRWAQGNWQALGLLRHAGRIRTSLLGHIDAVWYLLTPPLQLTVGFAFLLSILFTVFDIAGYTPPYLLTLIFFIAIAFGPGVAALTLRGARWYSIFTAILLVIPYTIYSWMIFPVLFASLIRQLAGRRSWAKTEREALPEGSATEAQPG